MDKCSCINVRFLTAKVVYFPASSSSCSGGWDYYGATDHCYIEYESMFGSDYMSSSSGAMGCSFSGGYLVRIESSSEQTFINDNIV